MTAEMVNELANVDELYLEILTRLIRTNVIDRSMRILVACGGMADRDTLLRAGLTNFVISNLDSRQAAEQFKPVEWAYQDAECLTYKDNEFDFCIEHWGLHHCSSPHRAIAEMYRVSKRGIMLVEPADNLLTAAGTRLGIGQDYEHAAVFANDCRYGGVRNTAIPNFVYRFTASEVRKMLLCLDPRLKLDFRFEHHLQIPWGQLRARKSGGKLVLVRLAQPLLIAAHALLPQVFANQITAVVLKPTVPEGLHPWLISEGDAVTVNREWLCSRFIDNAPRADTD